MSDFESRRVARTWTHRLPFPPGKVFPLLCPVREYDWVEYWGCRMVYSDCGFAENNCVFTTSLEGEADEIWTVSRYDAERFVIEFVVVSPGSHIEKLDLAVAEADGGSSTVHWTRTYTSLTEAGHAVIDRFSGDAFDRRMALIGRMLAHYLATGEKLPVGDESSRG